MKTFQLILASILLVSTAHSWVLVENMNSHEEHDPTTTPTPPPPPGMPQGPMITFPQLQHGAEMFGKTVLDVDSSDFMAVCVLRGNKTHIKYDVRDEFPMCESIPEMEKQGPCNSSWAITAASVLTDRFCVQSVKAKKGVPTISPFSSYDLLTCGSDESAWDQDPSIKGCKGGSIAKAWKHIEKHGIVTGGPYESAQGCQPSQVDPMGRPLVNPKCQESCVPSYKQNYFVEQAQVQKMLVKTSSFEKKPRGLSCRIPSANPLQIQLEIAAHGPVAATMLVCQDLFTHDPKKVYEREVHSFEDCQGYAGVKIVGWGYQMEKDENNEDVEKKFWSVRGPWGKNFGDGGFVKVLREPKKCWQNGCIENKVSSPNFNFNKRTLYTGPWPLEDVVKGNAPTRPQDFLYVAY